MHHHKCRCKTFYPCDRDNDCATTKPGLCDKCFKSEALKDPPHKYANIPPHRKQADELGVWL